jgi:hypothetical protein
MTALEAVNGSQSEQLRAPVGRDESRFAPIGRVSPLQSQYVPEVCSSFALHKGDRCRSCLYIPIQCLERKMCRSKMEKVSNFSKFPNSTDGSAFQWPEKLVERSQSEGRALESEVESLEARRGTGSAVSPAGIQSYRLNRASMTRSIFLP